MVFLLFLESDHGESHIENQIQFYSPNELRKEKLLQLIRRKG